MVAYGKASNDGGVNWRETTNLSSANRYHDANYAMTPKPGVVAAWRH